MLPLSVSMADSKTNHLVKMRNRPTKQDARKLTGIALKATSVLIIKYTTTNGLFAGTALPVALAIGGASGLYTLYIRYRNAYPNDPELLAIVKPKSERYNSQVHSNKTNALIKFGSVLTHTSVLYDFISNFKSFLQFTDDTVQSSKCHVATCWIGTLGATIIATGSADQYITFRAKSAKDYYHNYLIKQSGYKKNQGLWFYFRWFILLGSIASYSFYNIWFGGGGFINAFRAVRLTLGLPGEETDLSFAETTTATIVSYAAIPMTIALAIANGVQIFEYDLNTFKLLWHATMRNPVKFLLFFPGALCDAFGLAAGSIDGLLSKLLHLSLLSEIFTIAPLLFCQLVPYIIYNFFKALPDEIAEIKVIEALNNEYPTAEKIDCKNGVVSLSGQEGLINKLLTEEKSETTTKLTTPADITPVRNCPHGVVFKLEYFKETIQSRLGIIQETRALV